MRLPSILTILLVLVVATTTHGRPYSPHRGSWMWENSEFVFAARIIKVTANESNSGQVTLVLEYKDLQSFKGAEWFQKKGRFIVTFPSTTGERTGSYSREFPGNWVSLFFLNNKEGTLHPPEDAEMQFSASIAYDGPLSQLRFLKDLLIYAGGHPLAESHDFIDLMSGFRDPEIRACLANISRSSDPGTAYFALLALFRGNAPNASKLAQEALERCKDTLSPGMKRDLEDRVQKYPPTQPPL